MAQSFSLALDVESWLPPRQWREASAATRKKLLNRACDLAASEKRRQVRAGIGGDGAALLPVKPASRPDGANGKPLDPHYGESRSIRWLRAVPGHKGGTVTLYWSHGFGRILGYHAEGLVRGAPVRDVIGFPPAALARLQADVRHFWRGLVRKAGSTPPTPPRRPPAAPALPMGPRRTIRRPAAGPPRPRP